MLINQQLSVRQVSIILRDVGFIISNVRRAAEVVTVIEESLFFCGVVWNITVSSMWVIRVARVIP